MDSFSSIARGHGGGRKGPPLHLELGLDETQQLPSQPPSIMSNNSHPLSSPSDKSHHNEAITINMSVDSDSFSKEKNTSSISPDSLSLTQPIQSMRIQDSNLQGKCVYSV